MKGIWKGALVAMALSAGAAGKASATSWLGNGSYCGGDAFSTCFSVNLSWTFTDATHIAVTLQMRNDDTFNTGLKWFGVGMDRLAADVTGTMDSGPAGYTSNTPNDFNGSPFVDNSVWGGNSGGSDPGTAFRTWTFTLTGNSRTSAQWDTMMQAAGVGYHAGGTDCGSVKVEVHNTGTTYQPNHGTANPTCDDSVNPPTEITPEPLSITLMATGLVGLAGAGFIKRRRNSKV